MFLTRENSKHCDHNARNKPERNLTDSVSGSPTELCKKHQTAQYKDYGLGTGDCGLWTADCGQWTTDSGSHLREKTLLPI